MELNERLDKLEGMVDNIGLKTYHINRKVDEILELLKNMRGV